MDLVSTYSISFNRFAVNMNGNTIVFYNYLGRRFLLVRKNDYRRLYNFTYDELQKIKFISWSEKGENLVICHTDEVTAFNIYTKKTELRLSVDKMVLGAYLLDNRKILLEYQKEIKLINQCAQSECSFYIDSYTKAKNRIVFIFDGYLTVLNLDFIVLFQRFISYCQIKQFDIYKNKYYYNEDGIIKGVDYVFECKDEISEFKLTKNFVYCYSKKNLKIFEKHSDSVLLALEADSFFLDKSREILYLLYDNSFLVYKKPRKCYLFQMIEGNITYKEREYEFDLSDNVELIP
ncbi:hypothetical protein THOM_2496 [Trachipleistophora hominis]|uniref:Uncharacterized protein n=1 Tax=Trachipleistophora hominis TaxID=72359 RepID=L7JSY0_TRAHO|nr:hypothetical protein THOM_2496 [Trachipleistophora hominis]